MSSTGWASPCVCVVSHCTSDSKSIIPKVSTFPLCFDMCCNVMNEKSKRVLKGNTVIGFYKVLNCVC